MRRRKAWRPLEVWADRSFPLTEVLPMLRMILLFALAAFVFDSPVSAANVLMDFSGGNATPMQFTLPHPISYTVTNDTPNAGVIFVFKNVGDLTGGATRFGVGSLSFTVNGGAAVAVDHAGTFAAGGVIDENDLSLFHANSPQGVNLGDVVLLSADTFFMAQNVSAPPPPNGLYEAVLADSFGNQLGTGTTVGAITGDYNLDGVVDAADYVVWRATDGTMGGYDAWRAHFGQTAGSAVGAVLQPEAAAVPESTSVLLVVVGATMVSGFVRIRA
jgi:hypothetical protein